MENEKMSLEEALEKLDLCKGYVEALNIAKESIRIRIEAEKQASLSRPRLNIENMTESQVAELLKKWNIASSDEGGCYACPLSGVDCEYRLYGAASGFNSCYEVVAHYLMSEARKTCDTCYNGWSQDCGCCENHSKWKGEPAPEMHGIENIFQVTLPMATGSGECWRCNVCGRFAPVGRYTKEQFACLTCERISAKEKKSNE